MTDQIDIDITPKYLYYEFGYQYSTHDDTQIDTVNYLMNYLILTSLILMFVLEVNQLFTLLALVLAYFQKYTYNQSLRLNKSLASMVVVFVANVFDHYIAEITIPPGSLLSEKINIITWIIEVTWSILFILQLIIIFQTSASQERGYNTVEPITRKAKQNYEALKKRIEVSEYSINDLDNVIDIDHIKQDFNELVKLLLVLISLLLLLDLVMWVFINQISGGANVSEYYFISGISFIAFIMLILFIGNNSKQSGQ